MSIHTHLVGTAAVLLVAALAVVLYAAVDRTGTGHPDTVQALGPVAVSSLY